MATPVGWGKRLGDQLQRRVLMADGRVLVVGGTHGNERKCSWLLEAAGAGDQAPLQSHGLDVDLGVGKRRPPLPQECVSRS